MKGVIVTIIADNYFGYSKKEIKSQISYSANLFGGAEEEHSGGAVAFPRFNLNEKGIARELSLPFDKDRYSSDLVESYRLVQGVLHNPKNDRRTTSGVFHIVEGGLPIPADKKAVPVNVYANHRLNL
jgi:hypothetical protein